MPEPARCTLGVPALSGAGDVDGDGFSDVLVGATRDDDGGADSGAAYLILFAAMP